MPNWCSNELIIKGDKDTINKFVSMVSLSEEEQEERGQRYDILQKLYPCPQELSDSPAGHYSSKPNANWKKLLKAGELTQEQYDELVRNNAEGWARTVANITKYGHKDWYDWQCAKWGTKWGDCDTYLNTHSDDTAIFQMNTAWCPPLRGIAHIATLFPTLRFALSYDEGGMGFFGFATFSNEGEVFDEYREYDSIDGYAQIVEKMNSDDDDFYDGFDELSEKVLQATEELANESGFYDLDKV